MFVYTSACVAVMFACTNACTIHVFATRPVALTNKWFCAAVERWFFFFLVNISALVYCAESDEVISVSEGVDDSLAWAGSGRAKVLAKVGRRGSKIAACSLDSVTAFSLELEVITTLAAANCITAFATTTYLATVIPLVREYVV